MDVKTILYWASTAIVSVAMLGSAIAYLGGSMTAGLAELGYPSYFAYILGSWKGLVAPALLVPGVRRLKEWTYAGLLFTFTGAAVSHAAVGDGLVHTLIPLVFLGVLAPSYVLVDEVRFRHVHHE